MSVYLNLFMRVAERVPIRLDAGFQRRCLPVALQANADRAPSSSRSTIRSGPYPRRRVLPVKYLKGKTPKGPRIVVDIFGGHWGSIVHQTP
jgi:hypothetical protein